LDEDRIMKYVQSQEKQVEAAQTKPFGND
jgi:hypothetical protein